VARILFAGAVLVLAVQLPRLGEGDAVRADPILVVLPVAAIATFLLGLGIAAAGRQAPAWLSLLAALASAVLALFAAPGFLGPPQLEFGIFICGGASLLFVAGWICLEQKRQSTLAFLFTAVGSGVAILVFSRAALGRYVSYFQSESIGLHGLFQRAVEMTIGFGLGGLLDATGAAIARPSKRALY
jgi:hypothetical protein